MITSLSLPLLLRLCSKYFFFFLDLWTHEEVEQLGAYELDASTLKLALEAMEGYRDRSIVASSNPMRVVWTQSQLHVSHLFRYSGRKSRRMESGSRHLLTLETLLLTKLQLPNLLKKFVHQLLFLPIPLSSSLF